MRQIGDLIDLVRNLRTIYTLVPWRVRPKLLALLFGSLIGAALDMAAVALMLPVMQLATGATIEDNPLLKYLAQLTGISDPANLLVCALLLVIALLVVKSLFMLSFRWWMLGFVARANSDAIEQLMTLYMTSSFENHRRRDSAHIFQALNSYLPQAFGRVTTGLVAWLVDAVLVVGLLVTLIFISPLATVTAAVSFGGAAWLILTRLRSRTIAAGDRLQETAVLSWHYLTPAVDGFKEARVAGAMPELVTGFARHRQTAAQQERTLGFLGELPRALLEIVMVIGVAIMAVVLFATVPDRAFGLLGVFALASMRIMPALNRLVATTALLRSNEAPIATLRDEIETLRAEPDREPLTSTAVEFPSTDIVLTDVSYRFPDATDPVLTGLSGVIQQGKTIALVGASGAGKSTFVDLLLALFNPTTGSISCGGTSIHEHPVAWRRQVGMVAQDVFLLDRSICENIAFGVPAAEIDDTRVREVVELAQLREFVAAQPAGLATKIGYRGVRVSGGQKQRIGIARALYRDPQLLVLDEATSALDNATEAKVASTIKALHGKMTIIVVAHRLSTVRDADEIWFFADGTVSARGTMADLSNRVPEFARLVELGTLR